jgi:hypothetical protein
MDISLKWFVSPSPSFAYQEKLMCFEQPVILSGCLWLQELGKARRMVTDRYDVQT